MKRIFFFIIVFFVITVGGFFIWSSNKYVVPIMMYHEVDYVAEPKPNIVSPENFERHMNYLQEHHYKVMSLDELVSAIREGKTLPRKIVVITFDDGYDDNYTHAFKILKKYNYPATIFMPSDAINKEGRLTLEQLKEMIAEGVAIGSHTRTEAYLPELSYEKQKDEIFNSKVILEAMLGVSVNYFAYPIGGFSEEIKGLVREAGYQGACTTNRGYDRFDKDVYELNRVRFSDKDNKSIHLWGKLSGYYNLFRKTQRPY